MITSTIASGLLLSLSASPAPPKAGDLLAIPEGGEPTPVTLDPDVELVAPADHRLVTMPDGTSLLAVPEQARIEPEPWKQRVRIIHLPRGF